MAGGSGRSGDIDNLQKYEREQERKEEKKNIIAVLEELQRELVNSNNQEERDALKKIIQRKINSL